MTAAAKDPLLQPYMLRHLTLRNRIVSTSHEPAYSEEGLPKRRYRLYHEEKAKGGCALTMIGGSSIVDRDSPQAFGNLDATSDRIVPYLKDLARAVHDHGAAVMCQITHLGRRTNWNKEHWLPVVSASPVREPAHRAFPKEAEDHDIRRIVKAYGAAARRCREGELDGVEIEAYGHLLDSFWSPLTNRRTDEYGGSLENRMRFSVEVLEEIRREAGQDFILGIRMVIDEAASGGIGADEGLEIARRLAAAGLVDFINVIKGLIETDEALSHVIPGMGTPAAPHLDLAKRVRDEIGLPVMHAARINEVATARHAIAGGYVDMIGMTRAHMADPHLVAKIMRGQEERIRPCIGAGYCIDRIYQGGEALCLHNPATGREETMPHVIAAKAGEKRRIVIVGAGPAGLEAARVSASRGHAVTVLEATDRAGGQVVIASKLGRRREIIGITDWLAAEVARLGIEIRYNTYAEAADVLALDPEIVVIATGGVPNTGLFPGADELATSTWDILSGQAAIGRNVLFYDDDGGHESLSCAEFAAQQGARMEVVTPDRMLAADVGGLNYPAYLRAMYQAGVTMTPNLRMIELIRDGNQLLARFRNDYDKSIHERRADQVIAAHGAAPADGLYFDLKAGSRNRGELDQDAFVNGKPQAIASNPDGGYQLFRVGDAVASRNIHAALYDSLRLCLAF